MASEFQRSAKLEYRPAANLVLEANVGRRTNEPTGEAESLVQHLSGTRMGDRVGRSRPAELEERLNKARKKRERAEAEAEAEAAAHKRGRREAGAGAGRNFLAELDQVEGLSYRPKTKESRSVYEQILTFVQRCLGDQPQEVLAGAAEEVLAVLKDDGIREHVKKGKAEELLGPVAEDAFARLVTLGKAINDFSLGGSDGANGGTSGAGDDSAKKGAGGIDEDIGVAVVFEDDDEGADGEDMLDEIRDEDDLGALAPGGAAADGAGDDDGEEGVDAAMGQGLSALGTDGAGGAGGGGGDGASAADDAADEAAGLVPIHKLDAYWLQRELNKTANDATVAQTLASEVMGVLGAALGPSRTADLREAENKLVALLDFERFDLIKTLLKNAPRVYYLTRLRQAQSDAERDVIRAEMAEDDAPGGGAAILTSLDRRMTSSSWAQDRAHTVTARVRKEARELSRAAAAAAASTSTGGVGAGIFASDVDTEEFTAAGTATVVPGARSLGGAGGASSVAAAAPGTGAALPAIPILAATASSACASSSASSSAPGSKPEKTLDLDSLSFSAGGHLMSNRRVELPEGSWRAQKKGYEEVHVPALKAKPYAAGEVEVPIAELPAWAQPAFKGMTKLNRVQSALYRTALFSAENMLLCAPTGAGKTNVAVLSILHELGLHRKEQQAQADVSPDGPAVPLDVSAFKIVYVAPMKALVQEVVQNLSQRLGAPYGLQVRMTGLCGEWRTGCDWGPVLFIGEVLVFGHYHFHILPSL